MVILQSQQTNMEMEPPRHETERQRIHPLPFTDQISDVNSARPYDKSPSLLQSKGRYKLKGKAAPSVISQSTQSLKPLHVFPGMSRKEGYEKVNRSVSDHSNKSNTP